MSSLLKLGVLASGRGSNLRAILDSISLGLLHARVEVVVSNTERCGALSSAQGHGIRTQTITRKAAGSRQAQSDQITQALTKAHVDLVVYAGFNLITPPELTAAFPNRMINIHPSLLPAFAGGMAPAPQAAALDWGVKYTGCTVHIVNDEVDGGPIIAQAVVPVFDNDDTDKLAARILIEEHKLLPKVIQWYAEDRVHIEGRRVHITDPLPGARH